MGITGRMPFGLELLIHLGAKTVDQHDAHAHALDQCQVLHDAGQFARSNGLSGDPHHEGLAPVHVDVGRHRPEPGDEGEIENGGHAAGGSVKG